MLSIVICSVNKAQLDQLKTNIEETAGIAYEIIAIDNSTNPRGITAVYNEGAAMAKYDYVCFMHEDIRFQTMGWGKTLTENLAPKEAGLIGVAGCAYKPKVPSGWGAQGLEGRLVKINLIQHYKLKKQAPTLHYLNTGNEKLSRVACVDGVFLGTKKHVALEFPFDEKLTGFHGYDIDFALSVNQKYQVYVTFEILLEHFSEGSFNRDWIESTLYVHQKWAKQLPINTAGLNKRDMIICEKRTFRFISKLFSRFVPISTTYKAMRLSALKTLNYTTYLKMYLSLLKAYTTKDKTAY